MCAVEAGEVSSVSASHVASSANNLSQWDRRDTDCSCIDIINTLAISMAFMVCWKVCTTAASL